MSKNDDDPEVHAGSELHTLLAKIFLEKLKRNKRNPGREPMKAADFNVVRQFLKDNGITRFESDAKPGILRSIADRLPDPPREAQN